MFPTIFILALLVSPAYFQDTNLCQPNAVPQGFAPHPTDCTLFYLCNNGAIKADRQCDPGQQFDIYDQLCKSTGAVCYPGGDATDVTCANFPGHTLIPSTTNCRQHARCPAETTLIDCPQTTPFFDYKTETCVAEADAFCYPGSSKDTTNPNPDPTINTCSPNTAFTYLMPHPDSCLKYLTCKDGSVTGEYDCPAGTPNFDYHRLECVTLSFANCYPGNSINCDSTPPREGAPNSGDCSKYTDCSVDPPVEKECDAATPYFDYRTGRCTTEGDPNLLCYPGTTKDPIVTADCGGTLITRNGVISFKPDELLTPNQRCIWTVNLSGASRFDLTLVSPASPPADVNILLVTVDRVSGQNAHFFHRPMNESSVSMNGSSLIIILHTKNSVAPKGFELNYHVTLLGTNPYQQAHKIITSPQVYKYPEEDVNYADNEASLIIFAPPLISPTFKLTVAFTPTEMEQDCLRDRLWALEFNASLYPAWSEPAFCYDTIVRTRNFDEMAVFFFESDDKNNGKGFTLQFTVA